jgi:hypothetical protein
VTITSRTNPSVTTVRRNIRDGNLFRENAADKIGL